MIDLEPIVSIAKNRELRAIIIEKRIALGMMKGKLHDLAGSIADVNRVDIRTCRARHASCGNHDGFFLAIGEQIGILNGI